MAAFLVYPKREGGDVLATLTADPDELPSRIALESESDASVDLFALYDVSDAPRFVTYVFQRTVAAPRSARHRGVAA
ncbi:hypothetical protein [Leifsonia poae]|uniref:hypothetical protein n=1 Tax=Leifsonia poae TaxID=110933 RepID=UPI0022F263E3|nr:hypothetical protein [Leifsonia poae]